MVANESVRRGWIIELAAYDVSVNVVFLGGADFYSPPPLGTTGRNRRAACLLDPLVQLWSLCLLEGGHLDVPALQVQPGTSPLRPDISMIKES
jgi:hypothetical protein